MPYKFETGGYRRPRDRREGGKAGQDGSVLPDRFLSVDALRGFDMSWIVGASFLVTALDRWASNPLLASIRGQLSHVAWEGFAFYDLIFPLFVFIVGVSAAFSIRKTVAKHGKMTAAKRVLTRGALLYVVGLFYSGGFHGTPFVPPGGGEATASELFRHLLDNTRMLGVLNRIALAYTATGLLFLLLPVRALWGVCAAILLGYWGMMARVPIRDIQLSTEGLAKASERSGETNAMKLYLSTKETVIGQYEPGLNVANHFDFLYLPGKLYDKYYDPEGVLSTIPEVATCLLGRFAGTLLLREDMPPTGKTIVLLTFGFLLMAVGYLWGFQFPVVKKLWTSSFVLVAGGYSMILLGVFHQVVDVWEKTAWCRPFVWVGSNALAIYLAAQILNYRKVAERFVGGPVRGHLGGFGEVLFAFVALGVMLWFARTLYKQKIFLRL